MLSNNLNKNYKIKVIKKEKKDNKYNNNVESNNILPINENSKFILTKRGYEIDKINLDIKEINYLKEELNVKPFILDDKNIKSFPVYTETKNKIIIPRFYGINKYGLPKLNNINCKSSNYKFNGTLRENQIKIMNKTIPHLKQKFGGILSVPCAVGKCLAKGTKILMYSGKIKNVEDIQVNDLIMGDDSNKRTVLSLSRGKEEMYNIISNGDILYTVNKSHILSLKWCDNKPIQIYNYIYKKNDVVDISIIDYLKLLKLNNGKLEMLKGYRVPIQFSKKNININPYNLGFRLGKNNYLNKLIPDNYKYNSIEIRLYILAGIIDAIGKLNYIKKGYDLYFDNKFLMDDVIYICRSLGFHTIIKSNHIFITGNNINEIPIKLEQNKINFICSTDDLLTYDIIVKPVNYLNNNFNSSLNSNFNNILDDYYGFEIDGNKRFVLGDFTVTHNTVMALYLGSYLEAKTFVLVHKTFLLEQWVNRAQQFTNAKVGILKQNKIPEPDCDIVVGMIQSISMRKYDEEIFNGFKLLIIDECHHYASPVFSKGLLKCSSPYILGLSATPYRNDKLTKVLFWNIGNIFYRQETKVNKQVICKIIKFKSNDKLFVEKKQWRNGEMKTSHVKMINNFVKIKSRNNVIINILNELRKYPERKILVLSGRKEHLKYLKKTIDLNVENDIEAGLLEPMEYRTYFYMGGMKVRQRKEAEDYGDMLFGTYDMAHEGLDIDRLNTIVLTTSKKDIVQSVGRIMRRVLKVGDLRPLIIDIKDEISIYNSQGNKRLKQYNMGNYKIENYYVRDDKILTIDEYLINEKNMNNDEILKYKQKHNNCEYIANWENILNLQKVIDEDEKLNNNMEFIEVDPNIDDSDFNSDDNDDNKTNNYKKVDFNNYMF